NVSSVAKRESDRRRAKSRVNIGAAFDSWRELRSALGIKTDPELAFFLLRQPWLMWSCSYERAH
uniref:Uncharacterized protein n=1 Tax=Cyprinus carpio TaxID=7962 RepID=A0A8C2BLG3_CYPCA